MNSGWIFWATMAIGISIQAAEAGAVHSGCPTPPFGDGSYAESGAAPLRFHAKDVLVVVHAGKGGTHISLGDNFLDQLRSITCYNASGCLLTVETMVSGANGYVCALVDGFRARPFPPLIPDGSPHTTLQHMPVSAGIHTIQTDVNAQNTGTLGPWEIDYTLYDRR